MPVTSSGSYRPPNLGDLYSSPTTNPSGYVPTSSVPGREHLVSAIGQYLGPQASNSQNVRDALVGYTNTFDWGGSGGSAPAAPSLSPSGGSSGGWGGGWGGGGGGGGGGGMDQAKFDWAVKLLSQGQPEDLAFNRLKLPKYRGKFRGKQYDVLLNKFNRGVRQDTRTANRAYNQLGRNLRQDYRNAFTNPNATYGTVGQAPGMGQKAMARMMQGQGIDPSVAGAQLEGAGAADKAFGNLWNVLAANEDLAQRNRLQAVGQQRQTTNEALRAAALQGRTGIGMQRAGALDEYRAARDAAINQRLQQQALANWQQRNQVNATNFETDAEYRNNVISSLLGMIPGLAEGVTMPEIEALLGDTSLTVTPKEPKKGPRNEKIGEGPGRGRRIKTPETGRQGGGNKRRAARRGGRR